MGREISEEEKIMCYILVNEQGLNTSEAGRRLNLCHHTVKTHSRTDPRKKTHTEKLRASSKRRGLGGLGDKMKKELADKGHTNTTYRKALLKRKGTDINEYRDLLAKDRGYSSLHERTKAESFERSGKPYKDIMKTREDARKKRKENKELVKIIHEFSEKENISIRAMGRKINISESTFTKYSSGTVFPRSKRLKKLYDVMGIESNLILDRFLEEEHQSYVVKKRYGVED